MELGRTGPNKPASQSMKEFRGIFNHNLLRMLLLTYPASLACSSKSRCTCSTHHTHFSHILPYTFYEHRSVCVNKYSYLVITDFYGLNKYWSRCPKKQLIQIMNIRTCHQRKELQTTHSTCWHIKNRRWVMHCNTMQNTIEAWENTMHKHM